MTNSPRCTTAASAVRCYRAVRDSTRLTEPWYTGHPFVVALLLQIALSGVTFATEERLPTKSLRESARKILADPEFRHFEHFADDSFRKPSAEAEPAETNGSPPGETSTNSDSESAPSESQPWWKKALNRTQPQSSGDEKGGSRNQRLSPSKSPAPGENGSTPSESGDNEDKGSTSTESRSTNARDKGKNEPATEGSSNSTQESRDRSGSSRSTGNEPPSSTPRGEPGEEAAKPDGAEPPPSGTNASSEKHSRAAAKTKPETKPSSAERPVRMQQPGPPSQRGSDGIQRPVRQSSRSAPKPKPASDGPSWQGPSLGLGNLLGGLFHGLAYLILAVIVAAIIVLIAQALMHALNDRQRTSQRFSDGVVGPLAHDRSPGETESDVFLRDALALAQQGDFRAAIGRLVLGGMSFIERQQWIRYRRGLTVHDYLRVLRSRPEQFAGFREVVHVFEPVEYGRRPATEPLFATALAGYQQGFQTAPVIEKETSGGT